VGKAALIALALLAAVSPALAQKTDVIVLANGDRVTGEIKSYDAGRLTVDTSHSSWIKVKWSLIASITSDKQFDVETIEGLHHYGSLAPSDPPGQLTIVSGNSQAAPADSALGAPLSVKVTDQYGNPVAGVTVNWSSDDGGVLGSNTSVTDANGLAQDTLTLGERGTDDVSVSVIVGTVPLSAIFTEQAM